METEVNNPFVLGMYVSPEYFCDREAELEQLKSHIWNGRNVVLTARRRIGKTGLIHHLFHQKDIREQYNTVFADVYTTSSFQDFVYKLTKSVLNSDIARNVNWAQKIGRFIKSLRLTLTFNNETSMPEFNITLGDIRSPETTLEEVFQYLNSSNKKTILAIDEFQTIAQYKESVSTEAQLRSVVQVSPNVRMIYSGSEAHILAEMFLSAHRPFYQSTTPMHLDVIPESEYYDFAKSHFEKIKRELSSEVFSSIYTAYNGCTWHVHSILNALYNVREEGKEIGFKDVEKALETTLCMYKYQFEELMRILSPRQQDLLRAMAREEPVEKILSEEFIIRNNLGTASSIQGSLRALERKGLVQRETDGWHILDYFLAKWILRSRF